MKAILLIACASLSMISFSQTQLSVGAIVPISYADSLPGICIVLNDGTKIPGKDVSYQSGLALKDVVIIDGVRYKMDDVRGYWSDSSYYGRYKKTFVKKVISGKVNVYLEKHFASYAPVGKEKYGTTFSYAQIYLQMRQLDGLHLMTTTRVLRDFLKDCEEAASMVDYSNKEFASMIEDDPYYLNQVFALYNNDCKKPKKNKR